MLKLVFTLLTMCLTLTIAQEAAAQLEASNWFFGNRAGLKITPDTVIILEGGKLDGFEGCAAISDSTGQLLFYTDGRSLWDREHEEITDKLNGNRSATQSGMIVPQPDNPDIYYVFTIDTVLDTTTLYYSVVNMSLNGGLGGMDYENIPLFDSTAEKITATKHCNDEDIWIITHGMEDNKFYSLLLTAGTTVINPADFNIQEIGKRIDADTGRVGNMKISPNGKILAMADLYNGRVQLFRFDNSTGLFSDPLSITVTAETGDTVAPYGIEFSPSSSYLYVTSVSAIKNTYPSIKRQNILFQYDLSDWQSDSIQGSGQIINKADSYYSAMQLALNHKIYLSRYGRKSLSAIEKPNLPGISCTYVDEGQAIGWDCDTNGNCSKGSCQFGLPNFIQSYFNTASIEAYNHELDIPGACYGKETRLELSTNDELDSAYWEIYDHVSGYTHRTDSLQPIYVFPERGGYFVRAYSYTQCKNQVVEDTINIYGEFDFRFSQDTFIKCKNDYLYVDIEKVEPNAQYRWSSGISYYSSQYTFFPYDEELLESYVLTITTNCHSQIDSFNLLSLDRPMSELRVFNDLCEGDTLLLDASPKDDYTEFLWFDGSTAQTHTAIDSGYYHLTLTNPCGIVTIPAQVIKQDTPTIGWPAEYVLCNQGDILLEVAEDSAHYQWGDGSTEQSMTIDTAGTYSVTVTNDVQCSKTASLTVDYIADAHADLPESPVIITDAGQNSYELSPGPRENREEYTWSTGDTSYIISVSQTGTYYVTATNRCATASDAVQVIFDNCPISMPNIFTPNGDGYNDSYLVSTPCDIKYSLAIYNRWGRQVFYNTSENGEIEWNGMIDGVGGEAPPGVYYYELTRDNTLVRRTENGFLHLLR